MLFGPTYNLAGLTSDRLWNELTIIGTRFI